ncbi:hypothetical protein BGI36_04850 [Snodgrassella communis]|uniref:hypothetical protein n=1 Tax=Snodgrassella communis TaxID=2946699 RepID=UPI000C1F65E3|nr:hypothetical protein [Snodgrassella communis]PIT21919.1 hypothetical protein BGI36_04850 [Snodgrassella communis]
MRDIKTGFIGGGTIIDLGTDSDVQLFFDCISYYVLSKYPEKDWLVLTDRFYRRYLKLEELDIAESLMKLVEEEFKQLDQEAIDWDPILSGKVKSDLDRTKSTLFDTFNEYFRAFYRCMEFAIYEHKHENLYRPIMVAITTIPDVVVYKQISLSVFDNLGADEKPIWWTGKIPK